MIDEAAARAETPGCLAQVFLDSAGSSLPPQRVVTAMVAHLQRETAVGGYWAAEERAAELHQLKVSLGRLLGCDAAAVALADSATRAWTQFVSAITFKPGDRVLITDTEYASNAITLLRLARRSGVSVEVIPSAGDGEIDLAALVGMLDGRVRLVSLVHVPANSGRVNPVREVADLAHQQGAVVLLDACQSVGQREVDLASLGADALTGTGRKWLRGPRGTGFLAVRPGLEAGLEPAALDLRGASWTGRADYRLRPDAARFELAEAGVAAQLGFGVAVDYLLELGPAEVQAAVTGKAARLRSGLAEVAGVTVHDQGRTLSGTVSFTVDGHDSADLRDRLRASGVVVGTSDRTVTLLDMSARGLPSVVRASPHYFVSDEQLDRAIDAVAVLAGR